MLELTENALVFTFPEVHAEARLVIEFQRTLRIPDDGRDYPLPPGLGRFPMKHLDDHADRVPPSWMKRGGVMLPMYQSEALWLNFRPSTGSGRPSAYPFAIKIAAGKINAASGEAWSNELKKKETTGWFKKKESPTDYLVAPKQPWLDGYVVDTGRIRQFVAMPLGGGYTAEEQITGVAEFGGIQVIVYPMRGDAYERLFPKQHFGSFSAARSSGFGGGGASYGQAPSAAAPQQEMQSSMGLAAGGAMKQEIYDDDFDFADWDHKTSSRCFVHLANSTAWKDITGTTPPHKCPTSKEYKSAGLPWYDYYDDTATVSAGSAILNTLKTVSQLGKEKGEKPLPENAPVNPTHVVKVGKRRPNEVSDGDF